MMFRPLQTGDRVAVIAPSSPFEAETLHEACRILLGEGLEVSLGEHVFHRRCYLAGSEAERAADLTAAFQDASISAVFCARGGYGSGRLLPWLPFSSLARHPKIFLGHSDVTFLHNAFQRRLGWTTFHGPNVVDFAGHKVRWQRALETLCGRSPFSWRLGDDQILQPGVARGEMVGGNLTCMVHLLGTPFFPHVRGKLLLLEECNEAPYRVDRMLTQLKFAGVFDRIAGLVLGQFSNCGDASALWGIVQEVVGREGLPIVADLPFGHNEENDVIPLGTSFLLSTHERVLRALSLPIAPDLLQPE